jgi:hypothetical protein
MSFVATPPPPPAAITGDSPQQRINFRLWQIVMSAATLAIVVWFFTLHSLAGILALIVAKHVWVAILVSGLTRYPSAKTISNPALPPTSQP